MNSVILTGNIAREPDYRSTNNGTPVCSFTIAVTRPFKDSSGTRPSDFINCVAWRNTAEFVHNYFFKGTPICIRGNLQTRNFEDSKGIKRYVTEVNVEQAEFNGRKMRDDVSEDEKKLDAQDLFKDELEEFKPIDDSDLPF